MMLWGLEINTLSVYSEPRRFLKLLICGGVCKLQQTFLFGLTPRIIGEVVGRFNCCRQEACFGILSQKSM